MGVFSLIRRLLGREKSFDNLIPSVSQYPQIARLMPEGAATSTNWQLRSFYGWVYVATSKISEAVSRAEWWLYYDREGEPEVARTHDVRRLFSRPNGRQSWRHFLQVMSLHYNLVGKVLVWVKRPTKRGDKVTLHLLRPDKVTLRDGAYQEVLPDGTIRRINENDVLVITSASPLSPDGSEGWSKVRAAASAIQAFSGISVAEWQVFQQALFDNLLVSLDQALPKSAEDQIRTELRRFAGADHAGKAMVLAGVKGVERIGVRPSEVISPEMHTVIRNEILPAFGVPAPVVGIVEDANRATAYEAQRWFIENTVEPELRVYEEAFNAFLFPSLYAGELIRCRARVPHPEDWERRLKEEELYLKNGVLTINEVRARHGMDAVPWGEQPWLPMSLLQVGYYASDEGGATSNEERSSVVRAVAKDARDTRIARIRVAHGRVIDAWARRFGALVYERVLGPAREYYLGQIENVGKRGRAGIGKAGEGWSPDEAAKQMATVYEQVLLDGLAPEYARAIADTWDLRFDEITWRPQMAAWYELRGADFWRHELASVGRDEAEQAVRDLVAGAIDEADARAKIERWFGRTRAEVIARTEAASAANGGAFGVFRTNGVGRKQWVATLDDMTRDSHLNADGQEVAIDEPFVVGGALLQHPGDPAGPPEEIINCRCTVAPVV